ncbi:ferric iron reductase protein FhuF [Pararhizobium capsulatum DSM 1112]|uniref:Ferric iron reductase protein FhuF n=1 Tax=Pararhizobium capsulatum DSM 1112 TaxID=1121113 RepID=A0ABU0BTL0_9HYPH|nr:siderophore-iron reductase FhuF [Pararhizobium capsulatum]MDQ0321024.1 ferric iron reductase protein FhuF [Pararhizobium capsulatum DSM 1112]
MKNAFGPSSLKAVFAGEHAWCGEKMMLSEELEGATTLTEFFSSGAFTKALDAYAADKDGADRRAIASMWSLYYFSALTIPYIVARRFHQELPVDMAAMSIALGEDGLPRAFGLPGEGSWHEGSDDDLLSFVAPLVRDHLTVIVQHLKAHCGIAPRLAWNNAAVYIDYAFNATARGEASDASKWASKALFEEQFLPDGTLNPFRNCLRHEAHGEQTICRRKVCCLRYRLPGIPSCGELCALPEQRKQ